MSNSIEFSFDEMAALADLIKELNRVGVPYKLIKDKHSIEITIGDGY
jgi:hypothetical protein